MDCYLLQEEQHCPQLVESSLHKVNESDLALKLCLDLSYCHLTGMESFSFRYKPGHGEDLSYTIISVTTREKQSAPITRSGCSYNEDYGSIVAI